MSVDALTATEAASRLGVSPYTVRRLADRGELTIVRIGRAIRYPRADVERLAGGPSLAAQIADEVGKAMGPTNARLDHLTQLLAELRYEVPRV